MARSEKNPVFEYLFSKRYDPATGSLSEPLVLLEEVAEAIRLLNERGDISLSAKNPANFMKDYLRSGSRNKVWPETIRAAGYTAMQRTGAGQCFEFVPLAPGEDPFPNVYAPTGEEPDFIAQTLSLPVSTRNIVRNDEQSVAQIAVKLNLVETLFASSEQAMAWGIEQITHLQNNVKLRSTEIDALYQATIKTAEGKMEVGAITVEVKTDDPIIPTQLANQVRAALENKAFSFCIPAVLMRSGKGELTGGHLGMFRPEDVAETNGELDLGPIQHALKFLFRPTLSEI